MRMMRIAKNCRMAIPSLNSFSSVYSFVYILYYQNTIMFDPRSGYNQNEDKCLSSTF